MLFLANLDVVIAGGLVIDVEALSDPKSIRELGGLPKYSSLLYVS